MESIVISTDALTLVFFTSSAQKKWIKMFCFCSFLQFVNRRRKGGGFQPCCPLQRGSLTEFVRGGMGEPIEKEGGCVAMFLGHEQSVLYIGIISWCQSVLYCTHCSKKSAKKLLLENVLLLLAIISSSSSAQGAQPEKQKLFDFDRSSQGTQWLFENKYAQTNEKNRERFPICFLKDCFQPSRLYLFISLFFFYKPLHRLPFHSVS